MSLLTSTTRTGRSRVRRAALVLSAGLFATTLAIGGGLAASAAPSILSASTATVNGYVTVTVSGFTDSEALDVKLDSTTVASDIASDTGTYKGAVFLPAGTTLGTHTISVVGTTSPTQSEPITIVAQPTVSPATTTLTVSAFKTTGVTAVFSGFTPGDTVNFSYGVDGAGGDSLGAPVTVDASGVVSATLRASDTIGFGAGGPGKYFLGASNGAGNINAQFVTITVVADPAPAAPATPVKARASFTG